LPLFSILSITAVIKRQFLKFCVGTRLDSELAELEKPMSVRQIGSPVLMFQTEIITTKWYWHPQAEQVQSWKQLLQQTGLFFGCMFRLLWGVWRGEGLARGCWQETGAA